MVDCYDEDMGHKHSMCFAAVGILLIIQVTRTGVVLDIFNLDGIRNSMCTVNGNDECVHAHKTEN